MGNAASFGSPTPALEVLYRTYEALDPTLNGDQKAFLDAVVAYSKGLQLENDGLKAANEKLKAAKFF